MEQKTFGFLFGAGAEAGYGMPLGGDFSLGIFQQTPKNAKDSFINMRKMVNKSNDPVYKEWLPEHFEKKQITPFPSQTYKAIMKDTLEQNKAEILNILQDFDNKVGEFTANDFNKKYQANIDEILKNISQKEEGCTLKNTVVMNSFYNKRSSKNEKQNKEVPDSIMASKYFSSLVEVYLQLTKSESDEPELSEKDYENLKTSLGKIINYFWQLQIGVSGQELVEKFNTSPYELKEDNPDRKNALAEIFSVNDVLSMDYSKVGLDGLNYVRKGKIGFDNDLEKNKSTEDEDGCKNLSYILIFAEELLKRVYSSVLDYRSVIDDYWRYLYSPKADWAKFCKINLFLHTVKNYIEEHAANVSDDDLETKGYYCKLRTAVKEGKFKVENIATTNYPDLIIRGLGKENKAKITFLNGSTLMKYDPYLNEVIEEGMGESENHFWVPFIFTQSATKPMTSIDISRKYVELYDGWKKCNAIVAIGFGFNSDDDHINSMIRKLLNEENKKLIVVDRAKTNDKDNAQSDNSKEIIRRRLKLSSNDASKKLIEVWHVNNDGVVTESGQNWVESLCKFE